MGLSKVSEFSEVSFYQGFVFITGHVQKLLLVSYNHPPLTTYLSKRVSVKAGRGKR
jgi:hypothetical protein